MSVKAHRGAFIVFSLAALVLVFCVQAFASGIVQCEIEAYDLDDGLVPEGWELKIVRAGHFTDGKLWGQPTDGGCWLGKTLDFDNHLTELRFAWDGTLDAAGWGLYTGVDITMKNGDRYTVLNISWTVYGSHNIVRFSEPWDEGWQGALQYYYPLEPGEFTYELEIEDEWAHFVGHRASDGSLAFDHAEPMVDLFLDDIERVEFRVYATTTKNNWLDNPSFTACVEIPDRDGDGIPDEVDSCPDSSLIDTVVIDGCDSGVPNHLGENGCTMVDLIQQIAATVTNHGDFVSGVADFTNAYKKDGILSGAEKGKIQSCAAQADIP